MSVTFSLFDFASIHAKEEIEAHNEQAARAEYRHTMLDLNGEIAKARIRLDGARRIAANTPIQLEAAQATERQAKARYQAGLGTIAEVADAERLLTESQIDNNLARLGVWRALLRLAFAQGDLTPFLEEVSK
jgi:outer membrane protein TolC